MAVGSATRRNWARDEEPEATPTVSVIIPAHNEAATIESVISSVPVPALLGRGHIVEIIVVDNNSRDSTASLARTCRAIVVGERRPGYGRALRTGFAQARGAIIIISDGDGTYPLHDLERLLAPLLEGRADFVTGSRMRGRIHPGAMPALHRYLGVPVLTFLVNMLFGLKISDGHCGMRAVTRAALEKMPFTSNGFEFATEMLIRAKQARLRIVEIPIEYGPRPYQSISKLRSWADGWQHLILMVREFMVAVSRRREKIFSGLAPDPPAAVESAQEPRGLI